jgi:hypothetical protein
LKNPLKKAFERPVKGLSKAFPRSLKAFERRNLMQEKSCPT